VGSLGPPGKDGEAKGGGGGGGRKKKKRILSRKKNNGAEGRCISVGPGRAERVCPATIFSVTGIKNRKRGSAVRKDAGFTQRRASRLSVMQRGAEDGENGSGGKGTKQKQI